MVLEKVKEAERKKGISRNMISISGPELFGYGYLEVSYCIEGLEGAEHCKNYVCQKLREKPHVSGYFPSVANKRNTSTNDILYNDKQMKMHLIVCLPIRITYLIDSHRLLSNGKDSEIELFSESQSADSRLVKPIPLWNESINRLMNHYIGVAVNEETLLKPVAIHTFHSNQLFIPLLFNLIIERNLPICTIHP